MTKFRWHRGGFDDSMSTTVEVNSMAELQTIFNEAFAVPNLNPIPLELKITPHCVAFKRSRFINNIEPRTGWNLHIVECNGSLHGYTDGPLN